jgi:glycosyltransferase involved in cell wall biosynthesis
MNQAAIRVLRLITRLNIGGPSIQAIELTCRLPARGYNAMLAHGVTGDGEGDMRYLFDGRPRVGYEVVDIPTLQRPLSPLADLQSLRVVLQLIRRFKPAILHTHMAKAGTVGRTAAIVYNRMVAPADRVRLVHTYHGHVLEGYFPPAKTRLFVAIERGLARFTDRIVAISPRIREELLRQYRIGRAGQYRVVPLGFDLSPFAAIGDRERAAARDALQIPRGSPVVTTVGRLTAIKQQDVFLDVARHVAAQIPSALFLIAGDGEDRGELEQIVRAHGLETRVRFLGWRRDLTTVYGATDVFLLTSRNEGTPVALIESMAAGCAGVSTNVGGVADVIVGPEVGRVAPLGDTGQLAAHVVDLLNDPSRRRQLGESGRKHALGRFGIDRLVDDVDRVYRELLGER